MTKALSGITRISKYVFEYKEKDVKMKYSKTFKYGYPINIKKYKYILKELIFFFSIQFDLNLQCTSQTWIR